MKDVFEETFVVDPAPAEVWKALTTRTITCGASGDLHYVLPAFPSFTPLDVPGASCTPIEERLERLLRVTKDHEPCAGTEIAVKLDPAGTGTRVAVVQSGFGSWFDAVRDAILTHGRQIMADFRLYLEHGVTAPGTVWGPDLGAQTRHCPVGLEIVAVELGGFAERAGMRPGDLLVSLRGIRVHNTEQLWTVLALTAPGVTAEVTWVREREVMQGKSGFTRLRSET